MTLELTYILYIILIEYSRQNFICSRCMDIDKWLWIFSYHSTKDWKLCNSLLDFIKLSGPHSGENICNAFVKSCDDFGILEKVNFLYIYLVFEDSQNIY